MASFVIGVDAVADDDAYHIVQGKHIVLKADKPASGTENPAELREWVDAFDAAVPQWERALDLPDGTLDDWRVDGFVIHDEQRFRDWGDLPPSVNFKFGAAISGNLWVRRQPSDYYTRHLLLHEGVHALAIDQFRGTGPAWFAEGLAEMLAVHRGTGAQVEVNRVPIDRASVPYWGRFKLMSQTRDNHLIPTVDSVLDYPVDLQSDVESYGWSWTATMLLSNYPEYRSHFIKASRKGVDQTRAFTAQLRRELQEHWPIVQARWRMLTHELDYGFDWERERIEIAMADPLVHQQTLEKTIRADRGWQSLGVRLPPGTQVRIVADGRCTLSDTPKPWVSEPDGVTIHYAKNRPLGQLLVCLLPNVTDESETLRPLEIHPVSSRTNLTIKSHSWMLFRINDYLDDLGNNRGGYVVKVETR